MGFFDRFRKEKEFQRPREARRGFLYSIFPRFMRGDYTLKNSELLFSAVSRIANALSAMPVQLYRGSEPVNNDLNDLIGFAPNGAMTSSQFFKSFEACRCTSGNGYAIKILDLNGNLERLDLIDPSKVSPVLESTTGELWYNIQPEFQEPFYVHNYYMLHVPFISTNGYTGINPVSVLQDTIGYSENIQLFSKQQLQQGVNAAVVLEAPASLGKSQKQQVIESFMETYRETAGNILLLESGVTAKSLNLSPVDTKIFEVEKITRSKVAMVYNIPPHLLGDYSSESYSSQEQQTLEFLTLTMLPIVTAYEQELNRKLLTREMRKSGFHFKFGIDSILRADAATQAEVNYKAVRSAWKTPDEIRANYGLPPLPGGEGNKAMVSKDLAPIREVIRQNEEISNNQESI